ncbi:MAG: methylated-DNA--[protein]-cysteine S-methyltransferase [Opitutaceae bacterium]|nr:methylated-DNA--[protein]-cysteine S-methyltransferase [Opitutaceae bacterium]
MRLFVSTIKTPVGPFSIAVDATGAVTATAFGGRDQLRGRISRCHLIDDKLATRATATQVAEYFAGQRTQFDLQLGSSGTPFQQRVWAALQEIPFGTTCSYGNLAHALKTSPRAIGRANATNPICLLVPCHRVIGADGSLTGFAFGETIKRRLIDHERAVRARIGKPPTRHRAIIHISV